MPDCGLICFLSFRPFEAKEIAYYASEVARGLHYLHRNKIFHRDIKVLLSSIGPYFSGAYLVRGILLECKHLGRWG